MVPINNYIYHGIFILLNFSSMHRYQNVVYSTIYIFSYSGRLPLFIPCYVAYQICEMTTAKGTKRKVDDDNRQFQEHWEEKYFCVTLRNTILCLLCNDTIAVCKEYNIKRHYETKYGEKYNTLIGSERRDLLKKRKDLLLKQQNVFSRGNLQVENAVKASYAISELIVQNSKPFSDGGYIKQCMETAADIMCPEKKSVFSSISLSRNTVTSRIEDMADDVRQQLRMAAKDFVFFSIALDESTDVKDTAQLLIFLRGINNDYFVTEELLALASMKDTTTGADIFQEVHKAVNKYDLSWQKLAGITTDGAPAMTGVRNGVVGQLQQHFTKANLQQSYMTYHCIIHQEVLCSKVANMSHVLQPVTKTVNLIRSKGLNHRQFQELLKDLDCTHSDVVYYTEVRWLSCGSVLKRFFDLRNEIRSFLVGKGKPMAELEDSVWLCDLAFLVDIVAHLNSLNKLLQGNGQAVCNLYSNIKAFKLKLRLWIDHLNSKNLTHFPTLLEVASDVVDLQQYSKKLSDILEQFDQRFNDFKRHELDIEMFGNPFSVAVDLVPGQFQMELIELQCDEKCKEMYMSCDIITFYRSFDKVKYKNLFQHALRMGSLFGSTYICEKTFSQLHFNKSSVRSSLSDGHLADILTIKCSSNRPDITKLSQVKQAHPSH